MTKLLALFLTLSSLLSAADPPSPGETPGYGGVSYPQVKPLEKDKPVVIRSRRLYYNDRLKKTRFVGAVTVRQGSTLLSADEVETMNKGAEAQARGHVKVTDQDRAMEVRADRASYTGQMRAVKLEDHVVLRSFRPWDVTATAREALYREADGLLALSGSARVVYGANHFSADTIQFVQAQEKIVMDGSVKAAFIPKEVQEVNQKR